MLRLCFKLLISALFFTQAHSARADANGTPAAGELSRSTAKAGHGMVVFGHQAVYIYHLPMWSGIHAWQIIAEVQLDTAGAALYQTEREAGSRLTTFDPQAFALATLAPGAVIRGTLFHGHFEQGGTALPRGHRSVVSATVKRLIAIHPLNRQGRTRPAPLYRVFGAGQEWYGASMAARAPAFDQVVALRPVPGAIPEAILNDGVAVTLPGLDSGVEARPQAGSQHQGALADGTPIAFDVTAEAYFSVDDLGD